ncbi:hypothetical protein HMPREF0541_00853 [Lacticaseibacillus rhamnosus ATCC 21052]|nr:hypothetical protein HMPREF0541_00853 [Lacticaseibacillus rhamnosus ATCC 21052]
MALGVMAGLAIAPKVLTRRLLRRGARYGNREQNSFNVRAYRF